MNAVSNDINEIKNKRNANFTKNLSHIYLILFKWMKWYSLAIFYTHANNSKYKVENLKRFSHDLSRIIGIGDFFICLNECLRT